MWRSIGVGEYSNPQKKNVCLLTIRDQNRTIIEQNQTIIEQNRQILEQQAILLKQLDEQKVNRTLQINPSI